jgi:hypothetical protein
VISVQPTHRAELSESDTELSLRRSQIRDATSALRAAEALANAKLGASRSASEQVAPASVRAGSPELLWKLIAAAAIIGCVVLGILLALR